MPNQDSGQNNLPFSNLPPQAHDAAKKVLDKAYKYFAEQIATQNPEGLSILSHLVNNTQPVPTLSTTDNTQGAEGQTTAPPTAPAPPPPIDQQIEQINKQAAFNVAKRNLQASQPPNFIQRFGQNLSKMEGGVTQQDQLANMQTIQKIAGAEPLQPKDISEMTAGTYKAGLEATHQALAVEGQKFTALGELYNKLNETKGRINQTLGTASDEQKEVYKSLKITAKNINTHVGNLGELINNRPKFSSKGVNSQTQNKGKMVGKYMLVNQ